MCLLSTTIKKITGIANEKNNIDSDNDNSDDTKDNRDEDNTSDNYNVKRSN